MNKKLLSIILLSYYSEDKINDVYYQVKALFEKEEINFEFIVIDDASQDRSFEVAKSLEQKEGNVCAYQLSRNFTSYYSIFAGLSVCNGTCAVAIPDDGQLPYETIVKMYRQWESGHKIIIPHRVSREDSFLNKMFSNLFYKIMDSLSDVAYPPGGADLFLIDREVIDIVNARIHPINTAIVPELLRLGFNPYFLPYQRPKGDNKKSRWRFTQKIKLAKDMFISSSSFPIKLISLTGVFFSLSAFILISFYTYIKLFGNQLFWGYLIPGWTSIIIFISFFSGLILLALGVIAEYIWHIYEEVKNRPGYLIKQNDEINLKKKYTV
jgi:dolichol-phosphate mannosyltransferase